MATRFQDPRGLLALIRACDYRVKAEMCPALQPASADRYAGADLASLAAAGRAGCPVSPCVSPIEASPLPLLEQDSALSGGKGAPRCNHHTPSFRDCLSRAWNDGSEQDRQTSMYVPGADTDIRNKEIQSMSEGDACLGGKYSWGQ